MRRPLLIAAGLLASGALAAPPPTPVYHRGILTCPDGSSAALSPPSLRQPSARELDDACSMRTSSRLLRGPLFRHPLPTTSREELNREAAKLIGPPK